MQTPPVADPRQRISELEAQARQDHELIEYLKADKLADLEHIDNLKIALTTARRIGAAIGIIMAARKITEDDAFQVLVHASQDAGVKLRLLADQIVETGVVPSQNGRAPFHNT